MINYYISVIKKYAVFSGRAKREEYWYFTLVNFIITFVLEIIMFSVQSSLPSVGSILLFFLVLYSFAVLLPNLGVTVRRLHDIGKNGWFILISLIPIIGFFWIFVLLILDSTPGDNKYGSNPKGVVAPTIQTPPAPTA